MEITLRYGDPGPAFVPDPAPERAAGRGRAWYRGDMHLHTVHSDGTYQPADVAAGARAAGLDFIASTDHNTSSAAAVWGPYAGPDLLIVDGEEITTRNGHWLAVGLPAGTWIDWRHRATDGSFSEFAGPVHRPGGLVIGAHPYCLRRPPSGSGRRPAADRGAGPRSGHPLHLGRCPGRAQLDRRVAAVQLSFGCSAAGRTAGIGKRLAVSDGTAVTAAVAVSGVPGGVVRLVTDEGQVALTPLDASGAGTVDWVTTPQTSAYVRAVRRPDPAAGPLGAMVAMTNPIFLGRVAGGH